MKKTISILLALMLVLGLGAAASAENGQSFDAALSDNAVTITKTLTVRGEGAAYPGDTLSFTAGDGAVAEATEGTVAPALPAIADVTVAEGDTSAEIRVVLPAFDTVGVYTYEITETDSHAAGVSYRSEAIRLVLTVIEQDGKKVVAAVHCEAEGAEKTDRFENVYSAGSLNVSKTVAGNLGDRELDFHFTVTFTAPEGQTVNSTIRYGEDQTLAAGWSDTATAEITLKHNESLRFDNIPAGVSYTVTEAEENQDGYTTEKSGDSGAITAENISEAAFTNTKTVAVDTGVTLDSLPYLLIAAAAVLGLGLLTKRRLRG